VKRITGCKACCERYAENKQQIHCDLAEFSLQMTQAYLKRESPHRAGMFGEGYLRVHGMRLKGCAHRCHAKHPCVGDVCAHALMSTNQVIAIGQPLLPVAPLMGAGVKQ
jgi:hypothetical protein